MPSVKPKTLEEYKEWANTSLSAQYDDVLPRIYKANSANALAGAESNLFFINLHKQLIDYAAEYSATYSADLFMSVTPEVKLHQKSFESSLNKEYRANVIRNFSFPREPRSGWIKPESWFSSINDLIRTTIICKFIDGPKFIAERLKTYGESLGLSCEYVPQQRDDGYYAYHFYIKLPVPVFDRNWVETVNDISIEIQLTTQLQEILYQITHRYYESTRDKFISDPHAWKWEVGSSRFRAGYICHTLHLLEGIILELRDKTDTEEGE